ncbi:MAG TPA: Ig-like domain-containing protein, partial [Anaerolineales bacterium]|nr:Ig-like domain-containing protein [Anaerolineales bacterium]
RDLILDNVYYLPPWEIKFAVDGAPEQITWRFDRLPGGGDDTAYLNDFYVVPPTCGDYDCRNYYIDLGFIPDSQFPFPVTGGEHTVLVTVSDYAGSSDSQMFFYTVIGPPPGTLIWQDTFESNLGWVPNPDGGDTATSGQWERADPQATYSGGPKQLGTTPSGMNDLVTGHLAGANATTWDVDGGMTSIRSPEINLPVAESLNLSFRYYLAHGANSSNADYLRVMVEGTNSRMVFEELGTPENDDGVWAIDNVSIEEFSGQVVHILISAADEAGESLVEAGIDNVLIIGDGFNQAPVADEQLLTTEEDVPLDIVLTGSDPEGVPITFTVMTTPTHGVLSGVAPDLVYLPVANYNGSDSFSFVVSDGQQNSELAIVAINVLPVNDAPVAIPQSVVSLQGIPMTISLSGADIDGDGLTFQVITPPEHGTLTGEGSNLIYVSDQDYYGLDSFTFVASDGLLVSEPANVGITVNPVVYIPVVFRW